MGIGNSLEFLLVTALKVVGLEYVGLHNGVNIVGVAPSMWFGTCHAILLGRE